MPKPQRDPAKPTGKEPRIRFLFGKDISPEEAARIINGLSPNKTGVASEDEVPADLGEDLNADEIDATHERVLDPSDDPQERGLPPREDSTR
jgi:hypothetical protein